MHSKQVIVMRTDLKNESGHKIRTGKLIAQGSHASLKVILDMMSVEISETGQKRTLDISNDTPLHDWINGRFTKVCLKCDSEKELLDLYKSATELNIPVSLITDAGLTEFNGVPTKTCIAIGPCDGTDVDRVTGHLRLL